MSTTIAVQGIYACILVKDMETAIGWYGKLMGRGPDDQPMPGMAQWRRMGAAGIQLWEDASSAGKGRITIVVPAMDDERRRLEAAGLQLGGEASGNFGRVAQLQDPEGNQITLAEPPAGFTNS